jgi:hypothetical protein
MKLNDNFRPARAKELSEGLDTSTNTLSIVCICVDYFRNVTTHQFLVVFAGW